MTVCPFCQIVDREPGAHVLYTDDQTTAFLDANPAVEGHTLVVPDDHVAELLGVEGVAGRAVCGTVATVTRALDRALSPDGFSTFYTSGQLVGSVDHAHVHVLPRFPDDGVGFGLARGSLDDEAGAALADRIRDAL